jgi:hypothetical protein
VSPGADAAADASATSGRSSACPEREPAVGEACGPATTIRCEYGTDPRPWCNRVLRCGGINGVVTWLAVTEGPSNSSCTPVGANPEVCPSTIASVTAGGSCSPQSTTCVYPEGTCFCAPPPPPTSGPPTWRCLPEAGCPVPRPHIGDVCPSDGQSCEYFPPDGNAQGWGFELNCNDGVWLGLYEPWQA